MKHGGVARAPVVFALIVLLCVVGLAAIAWLRGPEGRGDNVQGDNQQAGPFSEDFTGETLTSLQNQGWSVWYKPRMEETTGYQVNYPTETVSVTEDGTLTAGAEGGAGGLVYPASWGDYTLTYKFKLGFTPSNNYWFGLAFRSDNTWVSGTSGNPTSGSWSKSYVVQLGWGGSYGTHKLWEIANGGWSEITSASRDIYPDSLWRDNWHDFKLEASGSSLKVYIDDNLLLSATDSSLTSGGIGLLNCGGPVYFDDVLVSF